MIFERKFELIHIYWKYVFDIKMVLISYQIRKKIDYEYFLYWIEFIFFKWLNQYFLMWLFELKR